MWRHQLALVVLLGVGCTASDDARKKTPEPETAGAGGSSDSGGTAGTGADDMGADDTEPDTGPEDVDADGDGSPSSADCDDGDAAVFPGADEVCDGKDNDCDDLIDDDDDDLDLATAIAWHPDGDGDGYTTEPLVLRCAQPENTRAEASSPLDCDDGDASVSPAADEVCGDGRDDDCDGLVDCEDGDCFDGLSCEEDCSGGADEDADGLVDCDDDECWGQTECPIDLVFRISGGQMWLHNERAVLSWRNFRTFASGVSSSYSVGTGTRLRASVSGMTGQILRQVDSHVLSSCGFTQSRWQRISLSSSQVFHTGWRINTSYGAYLTGSFRTSSSTARQWSPNFFQPMPETDCTPELVSAVSAISWGSSSYFAHVPFMPVWSSASGCGMGARIGSACVLQGSLTSSVTPMAVRPYFSGGDWEAVDSTSRRLTLQSGDAFVVAP